MKPSFLSYYTARSGIDAARANLQTTGQNMTNANTKGYTRQRVDLYSVGTSGYNSLYMLKSDAYMGEGVTIGGISQIRDPYLDAHYRKEICKAADTSTQLESLNDLENIFDETIEEKLMTQFSDLKTQLEALVQKTGDPVTEKVVQTSALMLVKMFNQYADQIQVAKDRQLSDFQDGGIGKVNQLLKSISYLNSEIKNVNAVGDPALELEDQRNSLIDELAGFMNIEISTKKVKIGESTEVDELSINLLGTNGEKFTLIDNADYRKFELQNNTDETVSVNLLNLSGNYVGSSNSCNLQLTGGNITQQFTTGSFKGYLKMINSAGAFDTPPATERGIPYYNNMLDTLAATFADIFNQANSTNNTPPYDKSFFEASDKSAVITAGNIALSEKWINAAGSYITGTKQSIENGTGETQSSDNILNMINLFSKKLDFKTSGNIPLFSGTLEDYLTNISATLALDVEGLQREYETYSNNASGIDEQRLSVSGVSLDEEGINLVMFNQALTAASRFMTTIDEAIDTIINKMGLVGR